MSRIVEEELAQITKPEDVEEIYEQLMLKLLERAKTCKLLRKRMVIVVRYVN